MNEFFDAIKSTGIEPPPDILADGILHRFHVTGDKPRTKNGWYVLHNNPPVGAFGCWKRGISETWSGRERRTLGQEDKARYRANLEAARRQREEMKAQVHAECRQVSAELWQKAREADAAHPYLIAKGVKPFGLKQLQESLLLPIRGSDGTLRGLQFIDENGGKRFKSGTEITGGYFSLGKPKEKTLLVCEGYATGATLHEITGHAVAVAFNAGNLNPVAEALQAKYPDWRLILCADDDHGTEGNPGLTKATEAARAVSGLLAVPAFPTERAAKDTDFNDLWRLNGAEAVKAGIEAAAMPTPYPEPQNPAEIKIDDPAWPEPLPLPDGLHPVAPFDYELLPGTLRPWAQDICERVQCPPDFVAVGIMAGLGAVIGRKIGIRPQARTDWTVTPNQWGLIVGRPGVLKSPALEAALAPLKRLAAAANETHAAALEDHKRALRLTKLQAETGEKQARKALEKNPAADVAALLSVKEPEAPALRRYMANDTSPEALGELLRQNPNGLLVFRDELVSLLKGLDREDRAEGRGFYLTGWNGDSPYTFDRITRGMNLHIPAVCLSLLGSTQPGRLAEYVRHAVRGGAADDGLIQRFGLLVWPDTDGEWKDVDRWPDDDAKREAHRVFDYLDKLDPAAVGAQQDTDHNGEPDGLPFIRFDPDGLRLFLEWRTDLETRLRGGELHPAMESHLAKYRKLIPGLALILHLAEGGTGPVSESSTLQTLAWGEYLETHARRAYGSISSPETAAAKAILKRIRKEDLSGEFSARNIYRNGWALLSDPEQVADALRLLVDYHWLREIRRENTGGKPATVYQVNPRGAK